MDLALNNLRVDMPLNKETRLKKYLILIFLKNLFALYAKIFKNLFVLFFNAKF